MYDILEALKWVNKNIALFGGDPNLVTLFGESSGSIAIGLFCVSPLTKGLFSRIIMESGSPASVLHSNDTKISLGNSQKLAETLGCADALTNVLTFPDQVADCMRDLDAFEIAKTSNSFSPKLGLVFTPTYGDEFFPNDAREDLKSGNFHDVSVLIGNNRDELSFVITVAAPDAFGFFGEKFPNINFPDEKSLLDIIFKNTLEGLPDSLYQIIAKNLVKDDYRENLKIIYDFLGDFVLICPDVYFAESYSRYGNDVFYYSFEHRPSITPWASWMGVVHFEELKFVFGSPLKENNYTKEEVELSRLMMKIWSDFAKYGDPFPNEMENSNPLYGDVLDSDLEKWPLYSRETPLYLVLDNTTRITKRYDVGPHKVNCDLLRGIIGFP